MKKITPFVAVLFLISVSVVMFQGCSARQVRNAGLCGTYGAVAGALLNKRDPVKGALAGLVIGGGACVAITAMAEEAAREAARTGQVVQRQDHEGRVVRAIPAEHNTQTKCRKIVNEAWDNGKKVGETVEEVCDGQQVTNRYRY